MRVANIFLDRKLQISPPMMGLFNFIPSDIGRPLTDRELEIFELIGRGGTNSQIAEKLHISPKTVDAHRSNMKTKLDLPDASGLMQEAVLWAELSNGSSNP